MKTLNFIIIIFLVALGVSLSIAISRRNDKLLEENARISENLSQYGNAISTLTLSNGEIENELMKRETALTQADSILKSKNRKISQLENYIATRVVVRDTDTVYVELDKPITVIQPADTSAYYKLPFESTENCITIKGFILSRDSFPSLAITERSTEIKVFDIIIKRKWYQFWRPKQERFVESNCGDVQIQKIIKKR